MFEEQRGTRRNALGSGGPAPHRLGHRWRRATYQTEPERTLPLPVAVVEGRQRPPWYTPGTTDCLRARKTKTGDHQINPVVAQSRIGSRALDWFYALDFDLRWGRYRGLARPQYLRLLRMCRKRPRRSHASKQADKPFAPHSTPCVDLIRYGSA
jgi:hypothetical protein